MALNSATTIIPGKGTVFCAAPHTAAPVKATLDPAVLSTYTGWDCMGHTSRDNNVSLSKDGGDSTTKGSWWDPALSNSRDPVTWSITVNSLQVDALSLDLAFPNGRIVNGKYNVPSDGGSSDRAFYVLCMDGKKRFGIYLPRLSMALGDAPEISTDGFFEVQLSGAILSASQAIGSDVAIGDLMVLDPPVALVTVIPTVASALPSGANTGQTVRVAGSGFKGATDVKFGAVSATSFSVLSNYEIDAVVPAGSAGSANITVVTPAGTSTALTYTRGA